MSILLLHSTSGNGDWQGICKRIFKLKLCMASGIGAVALSRVAAFFQAEGYNIVPTDPSTSAITVHVCLDLGLFCYLTHWLGFIFQRGGLALD